MGYIHLARVWVGDAKAQAVTPLLKGALLVVDQEVVVEDVATIVLAAIDLAIHGLGEDQTIPATALHRGQFGQVCDLLKGGCVEGAGMWFPAGSLACGQDGNVYNQQVSIRIDMGVSRRQATVAPGQGLFCDLWK
jgi:hypothetical protein